MSSALELAWLLYTMSLVNKDVSCFERIYIRWWGEGEVGKDLR